MSSNKLQDQTQQDINAYRAVIEAEYLDLDELNDILERAETDPVLYTAIEEIHEAEYAALSEEEKITPEESQRIYALVRKKLAEHEIMAKE